MKIINDPRKKILIKLLEKMYLAAAKSDLNKFKKLNKAYNTGLRLIFGDFEKGGEGFEWDRARNHVSGMLQMKRSRKKLSEKDYSYQLNRFIILFSTKLNELKGYL